MSRQVIIGRLGKADKAKIPTAKDEQKLIFPLSSDDKLIDFGISDALKFLNKRAVFPNEKAIDLLILAAHVYAADTRITRKKVSQDSWTRELRLVVPVSNVSLWNATSDHLTRLLNFLTGDRWIIGFRQRPKQFETIAFPKENVLIPPPFDSVSLFSGGLDSLIGAIDQLEAGKTPLFISHVAEPAVSKVQENCFELLKKNYKKNSMDRLRYWLNIPGKVFKDLEVEPTTRGRSFFFFALGIFAASGIKDSFVLNVPENGFIALNIPLDPLRLGALSTRTTHPFYMKMWNELLQLLKIQGRVENPYWNRTKGAMVKECTNAKLLKNILPKSVSCSSYTKGHWHGGSHQHCGYCLPCLIRRASLKKDPTKYTLGNLSKNTLKSTDPQGQQIRSFQIAINRLNKNPNLANILIYKSGPLPGDAKQIKEFAAVYRRGMAEVDALLKRVKTEPE